MKSVALHNLGCKVNSYEIDVMQQMLQEKGYKIVPFDAGADIYIINTCTVTNIADRKSRQMLHRAKKMNPRALVVAVGCYVQADREEALKDAGIDLAVGNNKKKDLVPLLEEFLEQRAAGAQQTDGDTPERQLAVKTLQGKSLIDINRINEYETMTLSDVAGHTRAFIKIQDGCNQFCSYCIIPYVRGRVRSRNIAEIAGEVQGLVSKGCKEVVLTGIHISSYGTESSFGTDGSFGTGQQEAGGLLELIKCLHELEGLERIRLGSLEPRIITREFAEGLVRLPKVCPHFHLSLQSGCDATLRRMNRRYTAAEYAAVVHLLREMYVNPAFTTDVIVGFPGETEAEFQETCAFVEAIAFYEMHVFKYSRREGTKAAAMKDQVPEAVKNQRSDVLLALNGRLSAAYLNQFRQKEVQMLAEERKEINRRFYWTGYTKEYIRAAAEAEDISEGRVISGRIAGFLQENILLMEENF